MEFIYIGFSAKMLRKMIYSKKSKLVGVITNRDKLPDELLDLLAQKHIPCFFAENKREVSDVINGLSNKLYVMYSFGIILPEDVTKNHTIINIHAGSLYTNKGKNPVSWSILLNEQEIVISIHKISAAIDSGFLIAEIHFPIEQNDDYLSCNKKIIDHWPDIESKIIAFMNGKIKPAEIYGGVYHRHIVEDDYTLDLDNDSETQIMQKIKSQRGYRGAVIKHGNLKLYVSDYTENEIGSIYKNGEHIK